MSRHLLLAKLRSLDVFVLYGYGEGSRLGYDIEYGDGEGYGSGYVDGDGCGESPIYTSSSGKLQLYDKSMPLENANEQLG